jgi:hypothetical protein
VSQRRLELSRAHSRSGVQATPGTRVGAPIGIGEPATTTGGDQGLTLILTLTGGRGGDLVDRHPVGPVDRDRTPPDPVGPMTTVGPAVTNPPAASARGRLRTKGAGSSAPDD